MFTLVCFVITQKHVLFYKHKTANALRGHTTMLYVPFLTESYTMFQVLYKYSNVSRKQTSSKVRLPFVLFILTHTHIS